MRVMLVFPGLDFEVAYPLGLAAIGGALRAAGHTVVGLDVALDGREGLARALAQHRPEVVGIAVWTPNLPQARACARIVRAHAAETGAPLRLLLGGPHASLQPAATLAELDADAVVVGEGEATVVEVVAAWAAGGAPAGVRGCVWRGPDGAAVHEPPRPLLDLDQLPPTDRTVFDPRRYPHAWAARAPHAAPVVTSRGCPLACAHCPSPALHHRRWRGRAPEAVVAELRALPDYVGHVLIEDEHPTVHRGRWLALCRALAAARLGLSWSCPNGLRAETLDDEVVAAMAAAGCVRVALGIETTDPAQARRLGRAPLDAVERAAAACRRHGIEVTAYFMLGLPGAARREPLRQLRAAVRMGCSGAHFSLHAPLHAAALADAAPPPPHLRLVRTGLYLGFYGHPLRFARALRVSHASLADVPAALEQLGGWLRFGRRPGVDPGAG